MRPVKLSHAELELLQIFHWATFQNVLSACFIVTILELVKTLSIHIMFVKSLRSGVSLWTKKGWHSVSDYLWPASDTWVPFRALTLLSWQQKGIGFVEPRLNHTQRFSFAEPDQTLSNSGKEHQLKETCVWIPLVKIRRIVIKCGIKALHSQTLWDNGDTSKNKRASGLKIKI